MGETVDSRNTLRQNDAMRQRPALEALLHAAMFEEKLGMQVQNMFADIEKINSTDSTTSARTGPNGSL